MKKIFLLLLCAPGAGCLQAQISLNTSYSQTLSARGLGPSTMSGRITSIEGTTVNDQLTLYV